MLNLPPSQQRRVQELQHNTELNNNPTTPRNKNLPHVGTSVNSGQHFKETIGAFGIKNRNKKGTSLRKLIIKPCHHNNTHNVEKPQCI
jgi:hypothetical protein